MSLVSDDKLSALETLTGATGHVSDLERTWLLSVVSTPAGEQVDDLWLQLFLENGATSGDFNTAASEFLTGAGYTQATLDGQWAAYWAGGGGLAGINDPTDISDLAIWLDASDLTTLFQDSAKTTPVASDGDPVGCWVDKSTNAYEFIQATASRKPTYKTPIFGAAPALLCDSVGDQLSRASTTLGGAITVFIKMQTDQTDGEMMLEHSANAGSNNGFLCYVDGNGYFETGVRRTNSSTVENQTAVNDDSPHVLRLEHGGTSATHKTYVDGTESSTVVASNDVGTADVTDTLFIFARSGFAVPFEKYISQIIVYERVLSASEADDVETWLADK